MAVGTCNVRARRLASVQPTGVDGVEPVTQRPVPVVEAHQEGIRVVVDGQGWVAEDVAGLAVGADRSGEGRSLRRGVDRAARGRTGAAHPVGEAVVEGGDGVGGGPGGFDVQQLVDPVAAAGGVSAADRSAHVPALDGQRHQAAGAACDVPGQGAAKPGQTDRAVLIVGDDLTFASKARGQAGGPCDEGLNAPAQPRIAQGGRAGRGVFTKVCVAASNSSPSAGAIFSRTRIVLTTGGIATQGTSRRRPVEWWLPSSSKAFLNSRP